MIRRGEFTVARRLRRSWRFRRREGHLAARPHSMGRLKMDGTGLAWRVEEACLNAWPVHLNG